MPLNTASPMGAFNMGRQIGKADSPVTGIGIAIQRVVSDAQKKGLLQYEQGLKTQGAIDTANATQPLEFDKMFYQSGLDTQKAVDIAEQTQPFKNEGFAAQSREQGNQSRLTEMEKNIRADNMRASAGPQPKPEVFVDEDTGKTMVRNFPYDHRAGQWVERISPASFNLLEKLTGGGALNPGGSKADQVIDSIFENMYNKE